MKRVRRKPKPKIVKKGYSDAFVRDVINQIDIGKDPRNRIGLKCGISSWDDVLDEAFNRAMFVS